MEGMALTASLDIKDNATALLRRLGGRGFPRAEMHQRVAESTARVIQDHLWGLAATNRNKMGAPTSNFWVGQAAGVFAYATDEEALVGVPAPTMQRRFGGEIKPGPGKSWLAIPASRESYGKTAKEMFADLRFAGWNISGQYFAAFLKKGTNRVMFWLRKRVVQEADESILPTDTEIMAANTLEIGQALARMGVAL
ncbi:hypothetical protein DB346_08470 [Verrucomicrobia bacterium LW23]|nr:hypothetical protein DB346_08470 [Verrucomicrobia bacterium LW23]